jgi:hypothetical protein
VLVLFGDAAQEPLLLLLARNIQPELDDGDAVTRQVLLDAADRLQSLAPDAPQVDRGK